MKNFSTKLKSVLLIILSLFLVTSFSEKKNVNYVDEIASTYYYEESLDYLNNLDASDLDSIYNLADLYPLISEDQTTSDFCWIYSSMKSLESAFMVQMGEYYNFSEVGLGYLSYLYDTENNVKYANDEGLYVLDPYFNCSGNYDKFVKVYQNNGLVFESDFSNAKFDDINSSTNEDKLAYYSYVRDFATKELNSYIKPYVIYTKDSYYGKTQASKRDILKRFIRQYGAVFTGIQGGYSGTRYVGCFYVENNDSNNAGVSYFYDYDRSSHVSSASTIDLSGNHAVTIIGWNDEVVYGASQGAFLAMNSWGFETGQVELFYIPYDYAYFYDTVAGFICETPEETEIKQVSASESSFTTDILTGSKELKNFFCYDDTISLTFELKTENIENVKIKISSGNQDYTERFSVTFDSSKTQVTINLNKDAEFYGGYYTINFYDEETLIGKRSVYVYTATEIGNFIISSQGVLDSIALNNAFLNNNSTITINVSGSKDIYFMQLYLSPISSYETIRDSASSGGWKGFVMSISDISIINSNNSSIQSAYTSEYLANHLFIENTNVYQANKFVMQLGIPNALKLSDFYNCLIRFKFSIESVLYENCTRDYYINMFVSSDVNANSSKLYEITYVLNGGENDVRNITKYPIFVNDDQMTEISLLSPTKVDSNFVGWYLNEDCIGENITLINSSLTGKIVLYAKWDSEGKDYFDIDLKLVGIYDYNNQSKDINGGIIYGDTIQIKFTFIEKDFDSRYSVNYFFFGSETLNGNETNFSRVDSDTLETILTLSFPNLTSGNHTFKIKVNVDIAGTFSTSKEKTIAISVSKKEVRFNFVNCSKEYNGLLQTPDVEMVEGFDFYNEDLYENIANKQDKKTLYVLTCNKESKNATNYNYEISELLNNNYYFDSAQAKCTFVITQREIGLTWASYSHVYDGTNCFPEFNITNAIEGDVINFSFTDIYTGNILSECKNAGHYKINVDPDSISNVNYTVGNSLEDFEYDITPARVRIVVQSATDRVQTLPAKRAQPKYSVFGNYYLLDEMDIVVKTEAKNATRSGKYLITCTIGSSNYELEEITNATYTLTGFYYVYYKISNGEIYTERVEENKLPKGITKDDVNAPKFSKMSYSDDYKVTGEDIYVEVTLNDYSNFVYMCIFVGVVGLIGLIYYIKKRESRVR